MSCLSKTDLIQDELEVQQLTFLVRFRGQRQDGNGPYRYTLPTGYKNDALSNEHNKANYYENNIWIEAYKTL